MKLASKTPTDMTDIPDLTGTDDQGNNCDLWCIVDVHTYRVVFTNMIYTEAMELWETMCEQHRYVVETT